MIDKSVEMAIDDLTIDEGFEQFAYKCPAGKTTVGYGRNIDVRGGKGLTMAEGIFLLKNDVIECDRYLMGFFGPAAWVEMNQVRKAALINMRFQLGPGGFMSFEKALRAVRESDWETAYREVMDSKYAKQTPQRALRVASALLTGTK